MTELVKGPAGGRKNIMPAPNRINRDRVRQLLAQGCTARQICERLGINKTSVATVAAEMKREGKS